jgi:hypothetical protein
MCDNCKGCPEETEGPIEVDDDLGPEGSEEVDTDTMLMDQIDDALVLLVDRIVTRLADKRPLSVESMEKLTNTLIYIRTEI